MMDATLHLGMEISLLIGLLMLLRVAQDGSGSVMAPARLRAASSMRRSSLYATQSRHPERVSRASIDPGGLLVFNTCISDIAGHRAVEILRQLS